MIGEAGGIAVASARALTHMAMPAAISLEDDKRLFRICCGVERLIWWWDLRGQTSLKSKQAKFTHFHIPVFVLVLAFVVCLWLGSLAHIPLYIRSKRYVDEGWLTGSNDVFFFLFLNMRKQSPRRKSSLEGNTDYEAICRKQQDNSKISYAEEARGIGRVQTPVSATIVQLTTTPFFFAQVRESATSGTPKPWCWRTRAYMLLCILDTNFCPQRQTLIL